jgi:hypothetical protein
LGKKKKEHITFDRMSDNRLRVNMKTKITDKKDKIHPLNWFLGRKK